MAQNAARKYDAGAAAFFVETLCQDADTLLRFGFAMTLSEEIAGRLVYKTYESIVPSLPELLNKDASAIRLQLLRRAWELHHEMNQEGSSSENVLFPLLKPLDLETRCCLFLIDVVGLSIEEAREITKMDETELRRYLAIGRKRLLSFRFE
ncbi:hypothetical protein [Oligoflexus tunisiensis]|uniref:hypothetical protein n=1 Tax=Oligoflexus tunisiensis TaxID=708132 RepID=UPI00114CAD61|nr:hypothetical protein [Oligoflexus tunisiensis]